MTPAIPDILDDLGAPSGRSGILVASGSTAGIVLAPVIGLLADRFGRRIVLTTCLVIFGTFGLGGALAPTFELLLASRFLQGVGSAGLINLAVVLIGDHWSGFERTKIVGRNSAVLTVGLASLPLLSGTITELVGWRAAFSIYTLAFGTAGWVWMSLDRSRPDDPPPVRSQLAGASQVVRKPVVAMSILSGFFVFVAIFGLMLTVLPVYLAERFGLGAASLVLVHPGLAPYAVRRGCFGPRPDRGVSDARTRRLGHHGRCRRTDLWGVGGSVDPDASGCQRFGRTRRAQGSSRRRLGGSGPARPDEWLVDRRRRNRAARFTDV